MGEKGWTFAEGAGIIADSIVDANYLYEIYTAAKPNYTGRVTVPILWDKKTNTIVSNESAEIIRMFNSDFDEVGAAAGNFLPVESAEAIDEMNAFVYDAINSGVYKSGFATKESVYKEAVTTLFEALDILYHSQKLE